MALTHGPRFHAFLPLGNKAALEHDILFLLEHYKQPYDVTMSMPSSRRHRIIKAKVEINRRQEQAQRQQSQRARRR